MKKTTETVLVLGAGNIGSAMARGIAAGGTPVVLYNRSRGRLAAFAGVDGIDTTDSLDTALGCNPAMVLLCVETEAVAELLGAVAPAVKKSNPIIGSCAAVPTLADMRAALKGVKNPRLVRILPNIAATRGASVNLVAADGLTAADMETVMRLVSHTGSSFEVPERLFGPAMSLSSCGIAFALRYVRAQTEAAVALGLAPALATEIIGATLAGTAAMLADGTHPEALVDRVTTPGGLTIRGLNAMENAGFTPAVMAGIEASTHR